MEQFKNQQFINLETFKKNGTGVKTPLWFIEKDGAFYMRTPMKTWKVKRIRNNGKVCMTSSDARGNSRGTWVKAMAEIHDAERMPWVNTLITKKYGFMKRVMDLMNRLRGNTGQMAVIEVQLVEQENGR